MILKLQGPEEQGEILTRTLKPIFYISNFFDVEPGLSKNPKL